MLEAIGRSVKLQVITLVIGNCLRSGVTYMNTAIIIFIGLQASGKSSFFRSHFASSHELVSKDCFRNHKSPSQRQSYLIKTALEAGISVVVDNTNPTLVDRASLIQLGRSYNAEIIGYYFRSHLKDCLERNQQREGKARVPDVGIYATLHKLTKPFYAEGFDKLFYVKIVGDGNFQVDRWQESEEIFSYNNNEDIDKS
jgi:predicted kinase